MRNVVHGEYIPSRGQGMDFTKEELKLLLSKTPHELIDMSIVIGPQHRRGAGQLEAQHVAGTPQEPRARTQKDGGVRNRYGHKELHARGH